MKKILLIMLLALITISGCSLSSKKDQFWIVKIDDEGNQLWEKNWGTKNNDDAFSITKTSDGNFIAVGRTIPSGTDNFDMWIVKFSPEGNKLWTKTFGGDKADGAYDVAQSNDGSIVVVGYTYSKGNGDGDFWILKLDQEGQLLWDKTFGQNGHDIANGVYPAKNGDFLVAGEINDCLAFLRLDNSGNIIWADSYCGSSSFLTHWWEAQNICEDPLGNIYLTGNPSDKFSIAKLTKNGGILWIKSYGPQDKDGLAYSIIPDSDSTLVATGYIKESNSFGSIDYDLYTVKISSNGDVIWEHNFSKMQDHQGNHIIKTDEGYAIAGKTYMSGLWVKIDNTGNLEWLKTYGEEKAYDSFQSIAQTDDDGFILVGTKGETPKKKGIWKGILAGLLVGFGLLYPTITGYKNRYGMKMWQAIIAGIIHFGVLAFGFWLYFFLENMGFMPTILKLVFLALGLAWLGMWQTVARHGF